MAQYIPLQISPPPGSESAHTRYVYSDEDGVQTLYAVSTWRQMTYAHPIGFPNIPSLLESLTNYAPRDDDVWLCTHPKTGTNWMYEIVAMLLNGNPEYIKNYKMDYMIEKYEDINIFNGSPSPRFFNTHIYPGFLPERIFTKCKVVVVIRNPLSSALSLYHQRVSEMKVRHPTYSDNVTSKQFMLYALSGRYPAFGNVHHTGIFQSWFGYTKSIWNVSKQYPKNVLIVMFEELKQQPVRNISRIAEFLGKQYPTEIIYKIAELTKIENMKLFLPVKIVQPAEHATEYTKFFRKGEISEWKEHFTGNDPVYKQIMERFVTELADEPELQEAIIFDIL